MRRLLLFFLVLFLLMKIKSCASTISITSVVERHSDGHLLLKWEVSPDQDGNIDIYSSHDDSELDSFMPLASVQITDHVLRINPNSTGNREFFFLRTATAFSGIVTNRIIEAQNIRNFRDAGGYFTIDNRQIRWGMIYRSGDLSNASIEDKNTIQQLGIRTVLDFRSEANAQLHPIQLHPDIRIVSLPLSPVDDARFIELVEKDQLTRADAIRHMQEKYVEIINNHRTEFSLMFELLTDPNNFPILLTDGLGKDGVGLATFFILHVLGVPENIRVNDYMLSQLDLEHRASAMLEQIYHLSESMQQAVTAMLEVNRAYLNYVVLHIRREYGSMGDFIEQQLGVSNRKRNTIRRNLLYTF